MVINITKTSLKLITNVSSDSLLFLDFIEEDDNISYFIKGNNTYSAISVPVEVIEEDEEGLIDLPMFIDPAIMRDILKLNNEKIIWITILNNTTIKYGNRVFSNEVASPILHMQEVNKYLSYEQDEHLFFNKLTLAGITATFPQFKSPEVKVIRKDNKLYLSMTEDGNTVVTVLITYGV